MLTHARASQDSDDARLRAYERGAARWQGVRYSTDAFLAHLLARAVDDAALAKHAEDLFLSGACLAGDRRALKYFDEVYIARVGIYVGRIGRSSDFHQEVAQLLREKLLTTAAPKLGAYAGKGPLSEWIRAAALRTALNHARPEKRTVLSDRLTDLPIAIGDVDVEALRPRHVADLQHATEAAFQRLTPHERTLLRLHFLDQVGIDRLGMIYGVHRATVARWLVQLRRNLMDHIASGLAHDLGWRPGTVQSMYRLYEREIHLSLSRLLGRGPIPSRISPI